MLKRWQIVWLIVAALLFSITVPLYARHYALPLAAWLYFVTRLPILVLLIYFGLRRGTLTTWIFISILLGIMLGHDLPALAVSLRVLSQIFLRLIRTIIAPLIFATLVVGIAGHSNLKQVGRLALKSLIYFEIVTTLALAIGLLAINISKAGEGVHLAAPAAETLNAPPESGAEMILRAFPENFAKAIVENQVLQIVIFSVLFGIGLALVREERRRPLLALGESLSETMFKFTNIVMLFAPFGVGAAIAFTVATTGLGVLKNLALLLVTLYVALAVFLLLVLLPIALLARVPLRAFIRASTEPASIAFATASSEAALPRVMERMEELGVPRHIVAFVVPTGYSFNLDGSAVYQSLAAIFVAQAAGIHLTIGQQIMLLLTLMLASKGTAGVARASLVVLMGVAASFRLPSEPILILLGVDQLMDMGRTAVSVIGNCLATVVMARWEGEFPARTKEVASI